MSVVADKVQVEEIVVAEIAEDRSEPIAYKSVVHEISEPEIQLVATNEKIATELKDRLEHSNTYTEANSISAIENEINAEEILAPISSAQVLSELVVPEQVRLTQPIEVLLNLDVQKG